MIPDAVVELLVVCLLVVTTETGTVMAVLTVTCDVMSFTVALDLVSASTQSRVFNGLKTW